MDKPVDFFFHGGQNSKTAPLLLKQNECATLINPDMDSLGIIGVAKGFLSSLVFPADIHTIIVLPTGNLLVGVGQDLHLYTYSTNSQEVVLDGLLSGSIFGATTQGWWAYVGDGTSKYKFLTNDIDEAFPWGVPNPTAAEALSVSVSGGNVACYYSWVAKYSDGSEYETNLSAAAYSTQSIAAQWIASSIYYTGEECRPTTRNFKRYVAETMGTSGPTEPTWPTTVGGTVYDGPGYPEWAADTTYVVGDIRASTSSGNHWYYQASYTTTGATSGVSDSSEPSWPTTLGEMVTDGEIIWRAYSRDILWRCAGTECTIVWTVPVSTNAEVNYKRLYRTLSGSTYRVTEIANATSTHTDQVTDEALVANLVFNRANYAPPPDYIWKCVNYYDHVVVLVRGTYSNCFFWSEALEPQAFLYDEELGRYTSYQEAFPRGDEATGMVVYGPDLYIASASTIKRLSGAAASYWSLRNTLAEVGNVAENAMIATQKGVFHVWWDGVYLFNGYTTQKITDKCDEFFENINWTYASKIQASYSDSKYRLMVPYGASTECNRAMVLDFENGSFRNWEETVDIQCGVFSPRHNILWVSSGEKLGKLTSENTQLPFELTSRMIPTANLYRISGPAELHYEIDTNGKDVKLTFYYDNQPHDTEVIINTLSRERGYVDVPFVDSRTFFFKVTANCDSNVKIYEPWIVK